MNPIYLFLIDACLFAIPFFYISFFEKKKVNPKTIVSEFGFGRIGFFEGIMQTAKILACLIGISLLLSIVLFLLGINDFGPVEMTINALMGLNPLILVYLFVVRIFAEEFFFRAFLVPRAGILASSILFGALHYGYGSVAEVIGAFVLGLVLAYFYKRNGKIVPNYIAHLLYNFIIIAGMFL